jgi:uncharacterized protein YPO0396
MEELLGFLTDNQKMGFRLARLEVLNWGTFDRKIWNLLPQGQNSLLTGDIGSGKSTLVDAITTLLVPHNKITYNKAAGAEGKERNLKTYILGEYKNTKSTLGGSSPDYLRKENSYSVILGHFENEGLKKVMSLATVLWIGTQGAVDKFFVFSYTPLYIKDHFIGFDGSMIVLKKKLKQIDNILVTDTFREYSTRFRHEFGILTEKALDLFYQTVSMKSVGNLTDFVRSQMLEQTDVKDKITELKKFYEDLNRAYLAVKKAKDQLNELTPLVQRIEDWEGLEDQSDTIRSIQSLSNSFFASHEIVFKQESYNQNDYEKRILEDKLQELENDIKILRSKEREIILSISQNQVEIRINEIKNEILNLEYRKNHKESKCKEYKDYLKSLEINYSDTREDFYSIHASLSNRKVEVSAEMDKAEKEKSELSNKQHEIRKRGEILQKEIESLRNRKSLIPVQNLSIRAEVAKALNIDEMEIPFAGELVQIKQTEKDWVGAIERLLYSFGLSILVPENHYYRFSDYINRTHLRGKLIYFRTGQIKKSNSPERQSIVAKLELKRDSEFLEWLENHINQTYGNYICANSIEEFKRITRGITKEGLIKHNAERHEKDDRFNVLDSTRYILGWSNKEKLTALEKEMDLVIVNLKEFNREYQILTENQKRLRVLDNAISGLEKVSEYAEIDWKVDSVHIQNLKEEQEKLENSSDSLKELKEEEENIKLNIESLTSQKTQLDQSLGRFINILNKLEEEIQVLNKEVMIVKQEDKEIWYPKMRERLGDFLISPDNITSIQKNFKQGLDREKNQLDEKQKSLRDNIIRQMQNYKDKYREETVDVDCSIESRHEFKGFKKKIEEDDLPRHESRFKKELNENTIQNILTFKNDLDRYADDIESKISEINKSLKEIEYNSGTHIQIITEKSTDHDIRTFKEMLKSSLESYDEDEELFNEKKFERVKVIIDKFNSGERADIEWTNRVTDVKNWFQFLVDESYTLTGEHKERYADSGGKSGGQKEKLAYTILASALAYQFGLKFESREDRSFRFVVIDEAFGRGSDDSTRYGMELFKKMNLQLLIVTPLQKINVLEDYISTVHYVANPTGSNSSIIDMSIEDYKRKKKEMNP